MALVDTRFNSHQPNLTVFASNNVIKLGSVVSIVVKSSVSPGRTSVPINTKTIIGVNSPIPANFGSTTTVAVYVNSTPQIQTSNVVYKTFSVSERLVNSVEDSPKYATFNPRVTTQVRTESSKVAVYVRPVVVEESNRVFGYRIPYRNNDKLVIISDRNVATDRKPTNINERYVFVQDSKNNSPHTSQLKLDNSVIKQVEVQSRAEPKRTRINEQRKAVVINTRREPIAIETKIRPVNVIDDSIAGSGGGGGGGGAGGAGVLTEYWS